MGECHRLSSSRQWDSLKTGVSRHSLRHRCATFCSRFSCHFPHKLNVNFIVWFSSYNVIDTVKFFFGQTSSSNIPSKYLCLTPKPSVNTIILIVMPSSMLLKVMQTQKQFFYIVYTPLSSTFNTNILFLFLNTPITAENVDKSPSANPLLKLAQRPLLFNILFLPQQPFQIIDHLTNIPKSPTYFLQATHINHAFFLNKPLLLCTLGYYILAHSLPQGINEASTYSIYMSVYPSMNSLKLSWDRQVPFPLTYRLLSKLILDCNVISWAVFHEKFPSLLA